MTGILYKSQGLSDQHENDNKRQLVLQQQVMGPVLNKSTVT